MWPDLICLSRKRLIALAAQKFVSDIANDALQYCKIRQQGVSQMKDRKGKVAPISVDTLSVVMIFCLLRKRNWY